MRLSKKITVTAIATALSAVLLAVGAVIGVAELVMGAVASLLVMLVYIEVGKPYHILMWPATTLSVFFLPGGAYIGGIYFLVFGPWPILKAYVERTKRWLWIPIKLVYINAAGAILVFLTEFITGAPFFTTTKWYLIAGIWLLINVAFIAYDAFLTVMVRLYFMKYRKYFGRIFK